MENFVIESANKKILVNNVELDLLFDDNEFTKRMLNLSDMLSNLSENNNSQNVDNVSKAIDDLFGNDTCKKIFGCSKPSSFLLAEFLNYITKFVVEFKENRLDKIEEKYGAERLGE